MLVSNIASGFLLAPISVWLFICPNADYLHIVRWYATTLYIASIRNNVKIPEMV